MNDEIKGTPEKPLYRKVQMPRKGKTVLFMITCHEGWRESIVCVDMYEWAADWLIKQIQGRAYAPEERRR